MLNSWTHLHTLANIVSSAIRFNWQKRQVT